MEKFCQSCGIPLTEQLLGTDESGSLSNEYCSLCYSNGNFLNENITFEEMLNLGLQGIDKSDGSNFKKWLIKKMYPFQLKNLKRWKTK